MSQEYDPDLPPELAAATGIHEVPSENAISLKSDGGQGDLPKGSARVRPPLVSTTYHTRLFVVFVLYLNFHFHFKVYLFISVLLL